MTLGAVVLSAVTPTQTTEFGALQGAASRAPRMRHKGRRP